MKLDSLDTPVRAGDVAAYYHAQHTPARARGWFLALPLSIGFAAVAAVSGYLAWLLLPSPSLVPVVVAIVAALGAVWVALVVKRSRAALHGNVQLARLAAQNGLRFHAIADVSDIPGSPLHSGTTRVTSSLLDARSEDRGFVTGTHSCVIETASGASLVSFRFVALPLNAKVPHLVLANRSAGILSATESTFARNQRLSLEGDFDRTFALYCPEGYERDALYIMTPDLMVLLLDIAGDCELELVDDYAIIYVGPGEIWKRDAFERALGAIDLLSTKLTRAERYRDERTKMATSVRAEPARRAPVALQGRRLQGGTTWRVWLTVAIGVACIVTLAWWAVTHPDDLGLFVRSLRLRL